MSNRVYVHLSGAWDENISVSGADIVYFAPCVDSKKTYSSACALPMPNHAYEEALARSYVDLYIKSVSNERSDDQATALVGCFLNDYYSYTVRPIFSILLALDSLIREFPDAEIVVLSAATNCETLPLFGFRTTESLRGSPNLIGALVAKRMRQLEQFRHVFFVELPGDLLCKEIFRVSLVRSTGAVFSALFLARFFFLLYGKNENLNKIDKMVICRSHHQSRFMAKLASELDNVGVAVIPQLTQGSLAGLASIIQALPHGGLKLSIRELFFSLKTAWRSLGILKANAKTPSHVQNNILVLDNVSYEINYNWLAKEIARFFPFLLYRAVLAELVKKYKPKKIINFELVGRMAGIESLVAREVNTNLVTVQTALVSSRPHPVFPYAECFYADSYATREQLSAIGVLSKGGVRYAGPPYVVKEIREINAVFKIAFFTQPYEPEITLTILNLLVSWAKDRGGHIYLRLHPRDDISRYSGLINENKQHCSVDLSADLAAVLDDVDLTITRTSSVAKESIANGCPVVLCIWSQFDQTIKSDYLVPELFEDYCCSSPSSLAAVLARPERIVKSNKLIHHKIFADGQFMNLVEELNDI